MTRPTLPCLHRRLLGILATASTLVGVVHADDWWNKEWTQRQMLTIDTSAAGGEGKDPIGDAVVLVRMHDGNFQFTSAAENGADMRFVAEDGKTLLPYQVEKYDGLLNEAFVWVKVPGLKPGAKTTVSLYYGNPEAAKVPAPPATDTYDDNTVLVYHFSPGATNPADATKNGNNAGTPGIIAEGSVIGGGLRLAGGDPVSIPSSSSLEWKSGQALTCSLWVKPAALQQQAVLLSRGEGTSAFRLLLNQGVPVIESGGARSPLGAPLAVGTWSHLAFVAEGQTTRLFVNGTLFTTLGQPLPDGKEPILLGGLAANSPSAGYDKFSGDLDELQISKVARTSGWLKLAAVGQGTNDASGHAVALGGLEGKGAEPKSAVLEHLSLFGDIAHNMMFDGWMAIGICAIMIVVGWTVAIRKFSYLNSIDRGSKEFLRLWKNLSSDLTALNPDDPSSVSSLGGAFDPETQQYIKRSPLYHIYNIGTEEIRHRLDKDGVRFNGLSGRSIQAIRASLDAGMVHENHRLNDGLVYLTISIAGGPYVGLLGTVVGVMITFAIIAKSGEVNVNSIAPGIASALLATVVGLLVAIPALFIYSYLNGRIKNALGLMHVFIDEFVAKMAEFYRPPNENGHSAKPESYHI